MTTVMNSPWAYSRWSIQPQWPGCGKCHCKYRWTSLAPKEGTNKKVFWKRTARVLYTKKVTQFCRGKRQKEQGTHFHSFFLSYLPTTTTIQPAISPKVTTPLHPRYNLKHFNLITSDDKKKFCSTQPDRLDTQKRFGAILFCWVVVPLCTYVVLEFDKIGIWLQVKGKIPIVYVREIPLNFQPRLTFSRDPVSVGHLYHVTEKPSFPPTPVFLSHPEAVPVQFFSAIQSSVVLLSYDSRSTLIRRKKIRANI